MALLILVTTQCGLSQEGFNIFPFIIPADARSFAMGESFAALPSNPSGLLYNPAGLAGLSGIRASYSQRSLASESKPILRSFNVVTGTPIGVFAAQYNRDSYGDLPITVYGSGPAPMSTYDYDIGVGYAVALGRGFSIGGAVKYYSSQGLSVYPTIGYPMSSVSTSPFIYDFGLMYTFQRFHPQDVIEDSITIGFSYQNIGSGTTTGVLPFGMAEYDIHEFPQYFRAGLSYALRVVPRGDGDVSPFQAVFCGEYRSDQSTAADDAAGFGMEFTIDEIVSLRAGGLFLSSDRGAHIRYGAGVRLPFRPLGLGLALQGAVIPWYSVYAFSIDVRSDLP